jgi:hemerythrin-like domain-containing protein
MKRIKQLQPLSKEHHQSLVLAQTAIKISNSHNVESISTLCKKIVDEYPAVWMVHFRIEEESIFQVLEDRANGINTDHQQHEREVIQLCKKLRQEHLTMNYYYEQIKSGDYSLLAEFGELLKQHTRTEERQLFPLLDKFLNQEELDKIYQTSLACRQI